MKSVIIRSSFLARELRRLNAGAKVLYLYLCANADDFGILTETDIRRAEDEAGTTPGIFGVLVEERLLLVFTGSAGGLLCAVAHWWDMRPYSSLSHRTAHESEIAGSLCFVAGSRKYFAQAEAGTMFAPTGKTKCGIVPVYDVPSRKPPKGSPGGGTLSRKGKAKKGAEKTCYPSRPHRFVFASIRRGQL